MAPRSSSFASSSSSGSDDDRCSDWASDLGDALRTLSLFDDSVHPTPEAALAHDRGQHGFDLAREGERLGGGIYGRMRLVNWIRKEAVRAAAKDDPRWRDDSLLQPVIADDPLLLLDFDEWSDDDETEVAQLSKGKIKAVAASTGDEDTLAALAAAQQQVQALKALLARTAGGDVEAQSGEAGADKKERDDDTHYFDSYAENDIHEIMLRDTARTVSYGRFILSNPALFKGAVVMDVGCGTAILSMLAARAGAKHVYAIEASGFAVKARENVLRNGLADVVTVIQGKVEDITLPVDKVDIIVSEWMGYMLLYESMLDSVLHARDRFLRPQGLMIPSQTRLAISAITGVRLWRQHVDFWQDVYGFDMSGMAGPCFGEGIVDFVDAKEVVSTEAIVRDINTHIATPASLDFTSSFTLASTSATSTSVRAFLTYFDTFFSPVSGEGGHVPPKQPVALDRFADDLVRQPIEPVPAPTDGGAGVAVSFSTGPRGQPTHWKQVAFMLREPFMLEAGQRVDGTFVCRKSATNSRELDVEIRFTVGGVQRAQAYRVR